MGFALDCDCDDDKLPVLMIINFTGSANNFSLKNNTAYEGEEEVLLQDGVNYLVEKV